MRKETRTCQMSMMYEITIKPKKIQMGSSQGRKEFARGAYCVQAFLE